MKLVGEVGYSDFNENPVINFVFALGLWLRVCQKTDKIVGYESCPPLQAQYQCKRSYSKQVLKGSANSFILARSVPANSFNFVTKAPVNSLFTKEFQDMTFLYHQNKILLFIISLLIMTSSSPYDWNILFDFIDMRKIIHWRTVVKT